MIIRHLQDIPDSQVSHNAKISKKQILNNQLCPSLTQFSQATFPPGENAPSHCHADMTEVFFIQSGCGNIIIDQQHYPISGGTTITVQPGEFHELQNTGAEDLVVLYFGIVDQ
ncbi:cupin domain-containing protein [Oceanicoccus sp. KOV_DT_Chl]|uniref:cupin domain-containing protein n=1 Tax=Oceanicoccus sp. KOV_DT_Chl TaxID=1904639 RepID=UPI000C7D1080|nr:cupin domain-containing protein [Oceanicoccus sp. KOV_DT_Chl]